MPPLFLRSQVALEARIVPKTGVTRLRFDRGWVSISSARDGSLLLQRIGDTDSGGGSGQQAQGQQRGALSLTPYDGPGIQRTYTVCFHIIRNLETMHD